ncbi:hypothetical protein B0T25DRAFT_436725, partial [Lasiosphaeria hispida]
MRLFTPFAAGWLLGQVRSESSPWYWATTVITETVWTICSGEETVTVFEQGPLSTDIVFADSNVSLTNITVQPASSPTSCYSLPTPTSSLEVVAFAASKEASADSTNPVFFYVGENATTPEYVGTLVDGNRCFLDISSDASAAGRVGLILSSGESIVFDESGIHHFDADCGSESSVTISDFLDQITSITERLAQSNTTGNWFGAAPRRRAMAQTNFTVAMEIEDVISDQLSEPHLAYGPSDCTFLSREISETWDILTWTCQYPGANSKEKVCEQSFHSWLNPSPDASNNTIGNSSVASDNKLFKHLPQFLKQFGSPLAALFPLSPPLLHALAWLDTAQNAVRDAAELGGSSLCQVLHAQEQYEIVLADPGLPSPHTIGVYASPPVPTISDTLASRTTRRTTDPPRAMQPTATGFPSMTETSF